MNPSRHEVAEIRGKAKRDTDLAVTPGEECRVLESPVR